MLPQDAYINEKQAHATTGLALSTLRNNRWLGRGIPFYKIGKAVRYKLSDVLNYMERHRIETEG